MTEKPFAIAFAHLNQDHSRRLAHAFDEVKQALRDRGRVIAEYTEVSDPTQLLHELNNKSALVVALGSAIDPAGLPGDMDALVQLVEGVRAQNATMPVFVFGLELSARALPTRVLSEIEGVINAYEDTAPFVARIIEREANNYRSNIAPPFFRALMEYANDAAYSWHCPGHSGGTAFLKSPVGTAFHNFFGENLLRADVCNAVEELGQLLSHEGPVADSERRAAETFGSDHLFFVTNGTSTSNKVVWNSCVSPGDIVLVDRNCHKSILHAIMLTGAIPIYLKPTRNRAGIIGPIPRSEFQPEAIQQKIEANPFVTDKTATPRILTLTQSTYDGIIYNAAEIQQTLDGFTDVLHFDEAWLPHAKFHPLYRGMHAIDPERTRTEESLVFSTQSTHKLLAGLSQASQILVQNSGTRRLDVDTFNESFMMHTSTSPQYSIIASCDVSAEMMRGVGGTALIEDAITEAMEFRRAIIRIGEELENDWWFGVWGPQTPPREGIAERTEWELSPQQQWHGFDDIDEDFTMLDPLKVTLTCPGLDVDGNFDETGIPGLVLAKYLAEHGVVVEKTGLYSLFVLFTVGATKGRWNTLIGELHRFKRAYDSDLPVAEVMPKFVAEYPQYGRFGLRELCEQLHDTYRENDIANLTTDIYLDEVEPVLLPAQAWAKTTAGEIEHVDIADVEGRVTAVLLTPYPPGIPLLVPGERVTPQIAAYLRLESELAEKWPGFNGITHGVGESDAGCLTVACVVE